MVNCVLRNRTSGKFCSWVLRALHVAVAGRSPLCQTLQFRLLLFAIKWNNFRVTLFLRKCARLAVAKRENRHSSSSSISFCDDVSFFSYYYHSSSRLHGEEYEEEKENQAKAHLVAARFV
jgi:hypothetical protein